MKYETPELTALTPAIYAVQGFKTISASPRDGNPGPNNDVSAGYEDWE